MKAAIQMDTLEGINIAGDSSFAILLAGQARGVEHQGNWRLSQPSTSYLFLPLLRAHQLYSSSCEGQLRLYRQWETMRRTPRAQT